MEVHVDLPSGMFPQNNFARQGTFVFNLRLSLTTLKKPELYYFVCGVS